jgi:hypothetical protein
VGTFHSRRVRSWDFAGRTSVVTEAIVSISTG